jgi:hypothetical protein
MDDDNGGKDGKPVIIVMPKYLKATKDTYDNFHTLTKQFQAATLHRFDSVPSPPDTNDISSPDSYDAKMTAFLDMMPPSTNSNSDDCSNANNSSPFSASPSNTCSKGHHTPPSNALSVPAQSCGLSYAAVTTSSHGSASHPQQSSKSKCTPSKSPQHDKLPPTVVTDRDLMVSTMTNAQQLDLLLEMHAMLKDQKHEIKKLKKQHKLSKRMTTNLQHRIDSICNSLDNLSRRTIDSDLSSALSMISSKARSDDSGSLDDSKDGADFDPSPSRPSTIFFSRRFSVTFDSTNPPAAIQPGTSQRPPSPDSLSEHTPNPNQGWMSPRKEHAGSPVRVPLPFFIPTHNSFSPLHDNQRVNDPIACLSSLGYTRSPSKKPNQKKPRHYPLPLL